MAEFNKYSLYGQGFGMVQMVQKDKIDRMVDEVIDLHMYEDVKNFVREHFGEVDGEKWFDYPDLDKKVYVKNEDQVVEICMLKGDKQYYGKGWKHIQKE